MEFMARREIAAVKREKRWSAFFVVIQRSRNVFGGKRLYDLSNL